MFFSLILWKLDFLNVIIHKKIRVWHKLEKMAETSSSSSSSSEDEVESLQKKAGITESKATSSQMISKEETGAQKTLDSQKVEKIKNKKKSKK